MPNLILRAANATGRLIRSVLPTANRPTQVQTAGYKPMPQIWFNQPRDLPPFNFQTVRHMLMDSGIRLNLATRTAPIFGVEFAYQEGTDSQGKAQWQPGVKSKNPAVAAWVQRQIETIWHNYLPSILRAQAFGWSGGEVTLKLSEYKLIEINQLLARHPSDVRLLKRNGNRSGVRINRVLNVGEVDLQFPYAWFHAFRPDDGEDYGNSVLLGAYSPWADKWFNGGALDTRRLFMHKDAYGGMRVAYPEESLYVEGFDQPISARDIATQIAEQRQSGGTVTYPSTLDGNGNPKWKIEEAHVASNPQHILQYPKDLDDEIRTGMEIPDDVISNDGSGAWAGKRIPLAAFYASLDTWVTEILCDLRFTLEPLVLLNWGEAVDFEICHKPLALQAMEQQGNAGGQQQPGQQQQSFNQHDQQQPYRMSLNPVEAVGRGVIDAASMVVAAKSVLRLSIDDTKSEADDSQSDEATSIAEILTHLYGDDAENHFDEIFGSSVKRMATFNAIDHPRGPNGRFIEKNSPEAVSAAKQAVKDSLSGPRTAESLKAVTQNLSILNTKQLQDLKREYGVKAGGAKQSLIDKIASRIHGTTSESPDREDKTPKSPKNSDVYTVPVGSLTTDPKRFQYKVKGIDESGVTSELKGVSKWNPELAGSLLVWRDPENGKDYVVNGHHRHELAGRLKADSLNVRYIEAKDATEARAKGALANIAEGRGTAIDAAKYLRDSGQNIEHLKNAGISMSGKVAADAMVLKDLAAKPFQMVTEGKLDEGQAIAVAKNLKDHNLQNKLFQKISDREDDGKEWSNREIETAAKKMAGAGKFTEKGFDLFGDFEEEKSTFDQEVELESYAAKQLLQEANDYRAVANKRRAERVTEAGNVLAVDENARRADLSETAAFDFEREARLRGPVTDTIQQYAAELATATGKKQRDEIKAKTLGSIRAVLGVPREGDRSLHTGMVFKDGKFTRDKETPALIEKATLRDAERNWPQHKEAYLKKNGFYKDGELQSVTLNTDDWRDQFTQYAGTNAHEVHKASSTLNKRLYKEVLETMKGKGNNTLLILGGGGGSGKGTATTDYFDTTQYPIVLDQASAEYESLSSKIKDARASKFSVAPVFIDRGVELAADGIIGRAQRGREKGQLARTVPLEIAKKANLDARKAQLELLERELDIPVNVVDNRSNAKGSRNLIEDRSEAIGYLKTRIAEEEAKLPEFESRLEESIRNRVLSGDIDEDIAIGLMGDDFVAKIKSQGAQNAESS